MNNSGCEIRTERTRSVLGSALGNEIMVGLNDPDVTDLFVDSSGKLSFYRRSSGMEPQGISFSPPAVTNMIRKMAGSLEPRANTEDGLLACVLSIDGSRVQAWLPPVTDRPAFAIRKQFRQDDKLITLDDYHLCSTFAAVFDDIVRNRRNALIVGMTGDGKTTILKAIMNRIAEIYEDERMVTIEDVRELWCASENWLALCANPPAVTQRELVMTAKRGRPKRVIVGEARDHAVVDMIHSMQTHPGLGTTHGSSIGRGLSHLRSLSRLDGKDLLTPDDLCEALDYVILMRECQVVEIAKDLIWRDSRFFYTNVEGV